MTLPELLQKINDGVTGKAKWTKPVMVLANVHGYLDCSDGISERFKVWHYTTVEPDHIEFVRINGKLEEKLNGIQCDGHKPEVEVYVNLWTTYFENILRYGINILEYEGKPVVIIVCETDKMAGVDQFPEWVNSEYEIVQLQTSWE